MVEFNKKNKLDRLKGFYFRYFELCRSKNRPRLPDIRRNIDNNNLLELNGDRFKIDDWLFILESLYYDQTLQHIGISLRKNCNIVLENINSEKKARLYQNKPVIFTKYIFSGLIEAVSNCMKHNNNLHTIALEGLPLLENYIVYVAKALSENKTIQNISFARSRIGDQSCELVCSIIKHLPNIEKLNMSHCDLTTTGAESIGDLIRFQKIYRFSEGWKNSLRYRDVDPDSIPGLKKILLNQNPHIGDRGLEKITEILKDDEWIKVMEMENCGLTDMGIKFLIDCLEINESLEIFSIKHNENVSHEMLKTVRMRLVHGNKLDETKVDEIDNVGNEEVGNRMNIRKFNEKIKLLEEQFEAEAFRRKQMEGLNIHLHERIMEYERILNEKQEIPKGYTIVEDKSFEAILEERDELRRSAVRISKSKLLKKKLKLKKAKSEMTGKTIIKNKEKSSKSEHGIWKTDTHRSEPGNKNAIEKDIGDTATTENRRTIESELINKMNPINNMMGMDVLQYFMRNKLKGENPAPTVKENNEISAKSLFMGFQK